MYSARVTVHSALRRSGESLRRAAQDGDEPRRRRRRPCSGALRLARFVEQRLLEDRRLGAVVDRPEKQSPARHRLGEEKALQFVALHLLEDLLLALVLDAFGDDLQAERMRELDHGVDDGARVGAVLEIHDEAAVDLQLLGRQLSQVAEARVTGAEVVDREVRAEFAETAKRRLRRL